MYDIYFYNTEVGGMMSLNIKPRLHQLSDYMYVVYHYTGKTLIFTGLLFCEIHQYTQIHKN